MKVVVRRLGSRALFGASGTLLAALCRAEYVSMYPIYSDVGLPYATLTGTTRNIPPAGGNIAEATTASPASGFFPRKVSQ